MVPSPVRSIVDPVVLKIIPVISELPRPRGFYAAVALTRRRAASALPGVLPPLSCLSHEPTPLLVPASQRVTRLGRTVE